MSPPPKIEEIESPIIESEVSPTEDSSISSTAVKKPVKNPFSVKPNKKTTIKRDAKDIYPVKKGLNKPQNVGNKPIDLLFKDLEDKLGETPYHQITLDHLYQSFFYNDDEQDRFQKRFKVIQVLFEKIIQIQTLSVQNANQFKDKNLINISLHDMKIFSKIINLIIIHGVYPTLTPFKIGVPFEKRNLNDFNKLGFKIPQVESLSSLQEIHKLMTLIYTQFYRIFSFESDVKDLLLKGTGYSDFLTITIALRTIPNFPKFAYDDQYHTVISLPSTFELFQTFTLLASTSSPAYFKRPIIESLITLHYDAPRGDGVLTLIEFVLGLRDQEEINIEKFEHISNVILTKPKHLNTVDYFKVIGQQIYDLLININRPIITSCLSFVLERLWNRNALVAKDFILVRIWRNFNPTTENVSEANLNNVVNVLISLTKRSLDRDLLSAIFQPILLNIWSYYVFLNKQTRSSEVITGVLVSYFTSMKENQSSELDIIAKNLLFEMDDFEFEIGPNGLVQISKKTASITSTSKENKVNQFLNDLDFNCNIFIKLLESLEDEDLLHKLFISILKRWLQTQKGQQSQTIEEQSPFLILIDLRLLESMANKYKDSLASTPFEILQIVYNFLSIDIVKKRPTTTIKSELIIKKEEGDSDDEDSDDEDDFDDDFIQQTLPTVLELLSAILSEHTVELDDASIIVLKQIQTTLTQLIKSPDSTTTIKNSCQSLFERIDTLLNGETPVTSELDAQRKILKRAITNLNDPLIPIRAHGLYLLRQLIELKTSVVTLEFVINLHLIQLKDSDPFIYINVIKGLESLIDWDEVQVVSIMANLYGSKSEDIDDRLKIGEVLLRYVQKYNELFVGESARLLVESCLNIIRRKVSDEQEEDNRLRMSSMSILGVSCKTNPLGIMDHLEDALDCAIGILQLETSKDEAIMRRAAIVLINDMIIGTSSVDSTVPFPKSYQEKVINLLQYIKETDNDLLTREHAQSVLDTIQELSYVPVENLSI
ncbi:protein required for cell viability [Scheffersomyces coipomensis]|uniref:protein required for cell viability n=1 Tax=Scheffersomyces coipomensis TaxID=1788519 RepID=UPI00315D97C9